MMKTPARTMNPSLPWEEDIGEIDVRRLMMDIEWSYSRRGVLDQCPRRYYYEYYAAPAATAGPDRDLLQFLKSLQNRHERIGTIAHLVIGTYFRKAQAGDIWTEERLASWARDIWLQDWTYSQTTTQARTPSAGKFPPVMIMEWFYGCPDVSELCLEAEKRLLTGVNNFTRSPVFEVFRRAGAQNGSLAERPLSLQVHGCRVRGRLDLAFTSNTGATVVDWKLSDLSGQGNDSLQLAVYALWAAEQFGCDPLAVTVCKAHLLAEKIAYFEPRANTFVNARSRILQDIERMAALHDYGRRGVVEAFTPCAKPEVCKLCAFQEVCPEGRGIINVGN
jgi:hypothetical protein